MPSQYWLRQMLDGTKPWNENHHPTEPTNRSTGRRNRSDQNKLQGSSNSHRSKGKQSQTTKSEIRCGDWQRKVGRMRVWPNHQRKIRRHRKSKPRNQQHHLRGNQKTPPRKKTPSPPQQHHLQHHLPVLQDGNVQQRKSMQVPSHKRPSRHLAQNPRQTQPGRTPQLTLPQDTRNIIRKKTRENTREETSGRILP